MVNNSSKMTAYNEKSAEYFSSHRVDLLRAISAVGAFDSALDIGCGTGQLSIRLKQSKLVNKITGVEQNCPPKEFSCFDRFFVDNLEDPSIDTGYWGRHDLIILADVLEHLVDPWGVFSNIVNNNLTANGRVVISFPNFRNIFTLAQIMLSNSFRYAEDGVLDKTHLRFFCLKDIVKLINNKGLKVEYIQPNYKNKEISSFKKNRLRSLNIITLNLFPYWIADQITVIAKRGN